MLSVETTQRISISSGTPQTPEFLKKQGIILTAKQNSHLSSAGIDITRMDHLGILSGIIDDLNLVTIIDESVGIDSREKITTGEAVKGMILTGLGFCNSVLSFTPSFFKDRPLEILFREGVEFEYFNRFKLGRSLEELYENDCSLLFQKISSSVVLQENIGCRFNNLDTTSFNVTGEYLPEEDSEAILLKHGYSKDHRPDLKQIVQEMIVSSDGGIPLVFQLWDGNKSDNEIFKFRAEKLVDAFSSSDEDRYLVADCKLYFEKNSEFLNKISYITRAPESIKRVKQVLSECLSSSNWTDFNESNRYQNISLCHYGIQQRWIVVFSDHAYQRADQTIQRAVEKEAKKLKTDSKKFHKEPFDSLEEGNNYLEKMNKKVRYHQVKTKEFKEVKRYLKPGKPKPTSPYKLVYQGSIEWEINPSRIEQIKREKACFVVATNIPEKELSASEVIEGYKKQSHVEKGFRFLKDPLFFASSFFLKRTERIQGLLMVMTLSLLVYAVAERRLRAQLAAIQETVPNQIHQEVENPTLRWIFQRMSGIFFLTIHGLEGKQVIVQGLDETVCKIIALFGKKIAELYQIVMTEELQY